MSARQRDAIDRRLIAALQGGLPLVPEPYDAVAASVGITPEDARTRIQRMLGAGVIRRIGVVPNHYALGVTFNAMTVWDVDDDAVTALGPRVGALDFVSHCYRRPRHLPMWPYNLFAMVHGRTQASVDEKVALIAELLGDACRGRELLLSKRILKKTGLRLRD